MPGTNLNPDFSNTFWETTAPVQVYVRRGTTESNTFVGSSQALGTVWEHLTLPAGTPVHALAGGVFVALDGVHHYAHVTLSDKHLFEHTYGPVRGEVWPLESLTRIEEPAGGFTFDQGGRRFTHADLSALDAQRHGRSIDYVYTRPVHAGA